MKPEVEKATGRPLRSIYSFASYYRKGAYLRRHFDRAECELTVGIRLFDSSGEPTLEKPYLFFGSFENPTLIVAKPSDATIFEGALTPHWRGPLQEDYLFTMLLHYGYT